MFLSPVISDVYNYYTDMQLLHWRSFISLYIYSVHCKFNQTDVQTKIMISWLLYSFLQAPEQVDRRQLKHKGELNPVMHKYRVNHLAQELQLASQPQPPSSLNSPSTPALGPSQFLELLANAMSSSSASNKGSSKFLKDLTSNTAKQFSPHTAHEYATHAGRSGGVTPAVHIKREDGIAGQSSKAMQGQGSKSITATTPQGSPGYQGGSSGSLAQLKTMERPKTDLSGTNNPNGNCGGGSNSVPDTPLTHFRTGGKPAFVTGSSSSSSCGQRATCNSGGGSTGGSNRHPLLASSTMANATKSEGQSSGQQASAQTGTGNSHMHVRTKGPVTRSTVRASSPSTCGDALPVVTSSPPLSSEKNAKSAEKPHGGLSSEEARKLRQAQQRLQKEQWMKKYGQGSKQTLELQSGGAGSSSSGDSGRQAPQSNSDTGAEAMENGVLISDGELNLVKGRHKL